MATTTLLHKMVTLSNNHNHPSKEEVQECLWLHIEEATEDAELQTACNLLDVIEGMSEENDADMICYILMKLIFS